MSSTRVLTGITTTGTPHLGNYVGAIRPAIAASRDPSVDAYLFLADYHALFKNQNSDEVAQSSREIAAMEPQPMRVWPSAAAITRLEQTFDWVLWIEEAERKLVWSRAARVPWKQISGELGCDRTTAWRRWQLALTKIAARLNAQ